MTDHFLYNIDLWTLFSLALYLKRVRAKLLNGCEWVRTPRYTCLALSVYMPCTLGLLIPFIHTFNAFSYFFYTYFFSYYALHFCYFFTAYYCHLISYLIDDTVWGVSSLWLFAINPNLSTLSIILSVFFSRVAFSQHLFSLNNEIFCKI